MFNYKFDANREKRIKDARIIAPTSFDDKLVQRFNPNLRFEILNFIDTVKRKFPEVDLSLFYQNLTTLKVKKKKSNDISASSLIYHPSLNKIVCEPKRTDSLQYGFLLVASTIREDKYIRQGFQQCTDKRYGFEVGQGLSQGYTCLLDKMLFKNAGHSANEEYLAKNIYKTLGREMAQYYFSADLKGLITSMERYQNSSETIDFIQKMDYINKKLKSLTFMLYKNECLDLYYECVVFTIGSFITKLMQDLENKKIDVYHAQLRLNLLFSNIPENILIWNKEYPIPHIEELSDAPNIAHINARDIARYRLTK